VPVARREDREVARAKGEGFRRLGHREELDVLCGIVWLDRRQRGHRRHANRLLAPHDELDVDVAPVRLELHLLGRFVSPSDIIT